MAVNENLILKSKFNKKKRKENITFIELCRNGLECMKHLKSANVDQHVNPILCSWCDKVKGLINKETMKIISYIVFQ